MSSIPEPVEMELKTADHLLRVVWADDRESVFPLAYLRGFCPCAHCQGHGGGEWVYVTPPEPLSITSITPVGNYAVSIAWNDGHDTGIYSWEILRELCLSDAARAEQGDKHPIFLSPLAGEKTT